MRKSNNRLLVAALVSFSVAIGGACNCGARLALNGNTTVKITSPNDGTSFLVSDMVTPISAADNAAGLSSLTIAIGSQQLLVCNANASGTTHIDCTQSFVPSDYASEVAAGKLVVSAVAISSAGIQASTAITIAITQPAPPDAGNPPPDAGPPVWFLNFVQPSGSNATPPLATVSAPSTLQMAIAGMPGGTITSIVVKDEKGDTLGNFTTTPYSTMVTWLTTPGAGMHTLTGLATDSTGATKTATLDLQVNDDQCHSDSDCFPGQRCCLDDGQCHSPVQANQDCDCAHPCQPNQGCFPGTCGKLPQQCRPGCFPGTDTKKADVCAPINGVQAYCAPLPPSQVTTQNKGGACAPGDGCSVTAQDCPDAPLNPGSDAGPPANPMVKYTCEPAAMNGNSEATVCFPAGTHPPQNNNPQNSCLGETDSCGSDTVGCVQGYECVGIEGDPAAGLACSKQCNSPYMGNGFSCPPNGGGGCPNGQYCDSLIGNGGVIFTTGVCAPLPFGC